MFDISFTWWNTGIDPEKSNRHWDDDYIDSIHTTIQELCKESDIIVLGEYIDNHNLYAKLPAKFTIVSCYDRQNLITFKNTIIFDQNRFSIDGDLKSVTSLSPSNTYGYRVTQIVKMRELSSSKTFELYIIHWRMHREDDLDNKCDAARVVADTYFSNNGVDYGFVLGDFNTEPFSRPFKYLRASRCRKYTCERALFWNPFWKSMCRGSLGTICDRGRHDHMCYNPVFDQILVSRSVAMEDCEISHKIWKDFKPKRGEHWPILLKIRSLTHEG